MRGQWTPQPDFAFALPNSTPCQQNFPCLQIPRTTCRISTRKRCCGIGGTGKPFGSPTPLPASQFLVQPAVAKPAAPPSTLSAAILPPISAGWSCAPKRRNAASGSNGLPTVAEPMAEVEKATTKASVDVRSDFEECRNYWLQEYPVMSEKTRSISRPLRKLFSHRKRSFWKFLAEPRSTGYEMTITC